ncbi:hypothetical protein Plhal304r1_c011g0043461 [Plasmopara halstedii]
MVASNILCRGFGFHGTNPSEAVQHTTVQFFNFMCVDQQFFLESSVRRAQFVIDSLTLCRTSPAAGSATSTSVGAIVSYTFGDEAC